MATRRKNTTVASKSTEDASTKTSLSETKISSTNFFDGFAGTRNGSFFSAPSWVDLSKLPGTTSQDKAYGNNPDWLSLLSGKFLFFSPNFVWLLCALFVYFVCPYPYNNIPVAATFSKDWIIYRATVNVVAVLTFFGFWHISLYHLGWGERPFKEDRTYRLSKVCHNIFYSVLGALQWTLWEVVVLHCYATGRLGYVSDKESFSTWSGTLKFVAWFFLVPLWREIHFYFAHRIIHNKVLYKYVHSIHHRNTDIEPFSGLSMHPVEHLYYFSCIGPALLVHATPFGFLWNGIHLLLSPAASHSGYEDNWQSDQFHYLHHRYFECNYGTPTFPFDRLFGTFRDQLTEKKSSTYTGAAVTVSSTSASNSDAKATLLGMPLWDQLVYNLMSCVGIPIIVGCSFFKIQGLTISMFDVEVIGLSGAQVLAGLVAFGPVAVAAALLMLTSKNIIKNGIRKTLLYPFHNEKLLGGYGFNIAVSTVIAVLPVYVVIHTLLAAPGESMYHIVMGKLY